MSSIKHILIPTDGSERSTNGTRFGGDLARALNARVTLLTVLDEQAIVPAAWCAAGASGLGGVVTNAVDTVREEFERRALESDLPEAAALVGEVPDGIEQIHLWGHAATAICDHAKEHDVDLIVMGSHGRSSIGAALLGSVSYAVVNRAPCAITIVR